MNQGNGNRKLLMWLLTALFALVLAAGSAWVGRVESRLDHAAAQGERISKVETAFPFIQEQLKGIDARLEKIEGKVSSR